jgi:rare lipoprotein A
MFPISSGLQGRVTSGRLSHVDFFGLVISLFRATLSFDPKTSGQRLAVLTYCVSTLLFCCGVPSTAYRVTKGTVKTTYAVAKGATKVTIGTGKVVYKVGEFTFKVVMAPLSWPLTHEEIESIDDLPPKEAISQGRVKNAPYVVHGKLYVPMSVESSLKYREKGIASWYGYETLRQKGGHMTANGEKFDPDGLNAAHKYLPLPTYVRVTNLKNRRSIIVRVNDRGPFVNGRIIDLSAGAARKLGFYKKGTQRVYVETIDVKA